MRRNYAGNCANARQSTVAKPGNGRLVCQMSDEEVEQRQEEVLVHPPIRCEELDAIRDDFRGEERHLEAALNTFVPLLS